MSEGGTKRLPPATRASEVIAHVEERRVETAADAAAVSAEGMRVDRILAVAMDAMVNACRLHQQMADALLSQRVQDVAQMKVLADEHVALLAAYRQTVHAAIDAEADAAAAERALEEAGTGDIASQMLAGIAEGVAARAANGKAAVKK